MILREVIRILTDSQQRLAGCLLGIDHIMGFKLDVEDLPLRRRIGPKGEG